MLKGYPKNSKVLGLILLIACYLSLIICGFFGLGNFALGILWTTSLLTSGIILIVLIVVYVYEILLALNSLYNGRYKTNNEAGNTLYLDKI